MMEEEGYSWRRCGAWRGGHGADAGTQTVALDNAPFMGMVFTQSVAFVASELVIGSSGSQTLFLRTTGVMM